MISIFQFFQTIPEADSIENAGEITGEIEQGSGSILPVAVSTDKNSEITGHSIEGYKKAQKITAEIVATGIWKATDYVVGDIIANSYTVQSGDTLWEIAEAYYGSGFEWKIILEANKSNIGFLPNGSQALIIPGQKLYLPGKEK